MAPNAPAAPITFVVPGARPASRGGGVAAARPAGLPGQLKDAVRVSARRGEGVAAARLVAVPGEDVVVLRIQGGPALVLHPENARDLLLAQAGTARSAGAALPDEVEVGARLRWRGLEASAPSRGGGFGDAVLAAVEVITGIGRDAAADFAASAVVAKVDGQVEAGVYRLDAGALAPLKGSGRRVDQVPPADAPILVLLHGTFVDTASTFGQLWQKHRPRIEALFAHYGGRVYALDHPTLGASPIANALVLAEALPVGARLHLATHSRGGLVAEVLARAAAGEPAAGELERFFDADHAAQRDEVRRLAALLKAKRVRVERVVRVACPARGTLLASRRLDAYLSALKWGLELGGVPVVPALLDFLMEVARRRADPAKLPGLAAMMPDSPLVRWLHGGAAALPGDLRVIAGDQEGDSIGSWIKTLLADAFYWTDNDIVVQTRSMYGGAPREGGASFLLDRGGRVDHFHYFINERTADALAAALMQAVPPAGFQAIGPLSWAGEDASGARAAARRSAGGTVAPGDRPAVVVLPGILGTHLAVGGRRVWLSLGIVGGLGLLQWRPGEDDVTPDGPIGAVYDDLMDHLARTHEVIAFGFDWRRPIEDEARRLGDVVTAALDARAASGQPVRLLAHSMGGLVARTMQLERPEVWQRWLAHPQARLLMLGTPNRGSWAPMQVLSGDDTFGNAIAALGSPFQDHDARQTMAAMPGFIQLQAGLLDPERGLDREDTWRRLADTDLERVRQVNHWHRTWLQDESAENPLLAYTWGVPPQAVLDRARVLWQRLEAQCTGALPTFADRLLLVVGRSPLTPASIEMRAEGLAYLAARDGGDGRVPLESAMLPGVRAWQSECDHGTLPTDASAFEAYVELLTAGATSRLPVVRTDAVTRGAARERIRPARAARPAWPPVDMRAVFASAPQGAATTVVPGAARLRVEVLNADLSFVGQPLMIGHYRSLALTGTERVVDELVGGALSRALALGLYPESIGSHQVFANRRTDPANPWRLPRPASVIVLGLGDEGALRETELARAVMLGVLAHAQRAAEDGAAAAVPLEMAATLLGSGGMGMTPGAAARAIARGAHEANQRLARAGSPQVGRLTLVEMYLDRATDAWGGLRMLAASLSGQLEVAPVIAQGPGALRRQLDSNYRSAGYDLVSVVGAADGRLEYTLDSRRARSEVRAHMTQAGLVMELVARAATDSDDDPQLGRTLFQLLVPPELEAFLAAGEPTVLELDDTTAAIPWELLDSGPAPGDADRRPWAIRSRLLRKRRATRFRTSPRDALADDAVLVIGEPVAPPETYAPLPGALAEAEAVASRLAASLGPERITALQHPDAPAVINALFGRDFRIVHVAGHGEPPIEGNPRGVVLSGGTFLGAREIESMRTVPELVFVNCCHLAKVSGEMAPRSFDRSGFAAGVAEALIGVGVRCVVAAGWAVEDGPAKAFAEAFYGALLDGDTFIEAVAAGRTEAWRADPEGKTWAAYQCYGDPQWTYQRRVGDAQQAAPAAAAGGDDVASPVALALLLEHLASRGAQAGVRGGVWAARLRALESRFASRWGSMGAVAEAFAVAWQAVGGTDEAIEWFERAVAAADGSASLRAQEQLANQLARRAWSRAGVAGADAAAVDAARAAIDRALHLLDALLGVQPTRERLALRGSALKRLGQIEQRHGRRRAADAAFERAVDAYLRAETLAREAGDPDVFYPALNGMAIEFVRRGGEAGWAGFDPHRIDFVRSALQQRMRTDPDFWSAVGLVELAVLEALARRRMAADEAALVAGFEDVHARIAATGPWGSVADQAEFLVERLLAGPPDAERDAAARLLAKVRAHAGRGPR